MRGLHPERLKNECRWMRVATAAKDPRVRRRKSEARPLTKDGPTNEKDHETMAVYFTRPKAGYTHSPNDLINDPTLSSNGFRVIMHALSKPGDWNFKAANVSREIGISSEMVYKALKELCGRDLARKRSTPRRGAPPLQSWDFCWPAGSWSTSSQVKAQIREIQNRDEVASSQVSPQIGILPNWAQPEQAEPEKAGPEKAEPVQAEPGPYKEREMNQDGSGERLTGTNTHPHQHSASGGEDDVASASESLGQESDPLDLSAVVEKVQRGEALSAEEMDVFAWRAYATCFTPQPVGLEKRKKKLLPVFREFLAEGVTPMELADGIDHFVREATAKDSPSAARTFIENRVNDLRTNKKPTISAAPGLLPATGGASYRELAERNKAKYSKKNKKDAA